MHNYWPHVLKFIKVSSICPVIHVHDAMSKGVEWLFFSRIKEDQGHHLPLTCLQKNPTRFSATGAIIRRCFQECNIELFGDMFLRLGNSDEAQDLWEEYMIRAIKDNMVNCVVLLLRVCVRWSELDGVIQRGWHEQKSDEWMDLNLVQVLLQLLDTHYTNMSGIDQVTSFMEGIDTLNYTQMGIKDFAFMFKIAAEYNCSDVGKWLIDILAVSQKELTDSDVYKMSVGYNRFIQQGNVGVIQYYDERLPYFKHGCYTRYAVESNNVEMICYLHPRMDQDCEEWMQYAVSYGYTRFYDWFEQEFYSLSRLNDSNSYGGMISGEYDTTSAYGTTMTCLRDWCHWPLGDWDASYFSNLGNVWERLGRDPMSESDFFGHLRNGTFTRCQLRDLRHALHYNYEYIPEYIHIGLDPVPRFEYWEDVTKWLGKSIESCDNEISWAKWGKYYIVCIMDQSGCGP